MAVPNTTTFSFFDVCVEIYGYHTAGMNLPQAFTDAIGIFDPAYVGSKNGLLCFRNYVHVPADVRLILHFMTVNVNTTKLNWEFVVQNGTVSDCSASVRLKNVTQSSAWFTVHSSTISGNTRSGALSELTPTMGVTNAVGDTFAIEMDLNGANTYIGTIQADFALTLNYDWTL